MTRLADAVRRAQLDNGIEVYLLENHNNLTVDLIGVIEGGLFLEPAERAGIGNLCAGMLDRGTRSRTQAEISAALESCGARLSYGVGRELFSLRARCLSEDLDLVLEILGDTLIAPTFPAEELELVKEDARASLREAAFDTYLRAYERASQRLLGPDHPYAREPLGRLEVIDRAVPADLAAWHAAGVAGARVRLVMVGDFDADAALRQLARRLGGLPAGTPAVEGAVSAAEPRLAPVGPVRDHVEIADKEQLDLVWMRPGIARSRPDYMAYGLANFIMGGSFISRLNQRLRDEQGLTYDVHSIIVSGRHPGLWSAGAGVAPEHLERAIAGVLAEMESFATVGATVGELELARLHLTGSFPIKLETNRAVAAALLEGLRLGKGLDFVDTYIARVEAISLDELNSAARTLFDPGEVVVVSSGTLA